MKGGQQEQSRASIGMAAPLISAPQASIDPPSPQLPVPTPATLLVDLSCLLHLVQFQREVRGQDLEGLATSFRGTTLTRTEASCPNSTERCS